MTSRIKRLRADDPKLGNAILEAGRSIVRLSKIDTKQEAQIMARLMAPEAWLEYDVGECTNASAQAIGDAIKAAQTLLSAGYRCCAAPGKAMTRAQALKSQGLKDKVSKQYVANLLKLEKKAKPKSSKTP
jgi:hypothetical protein